MVRASRISGLLGKNSHVSKYDLIISQFGSKENVAHFTHFLRYSKKYKRIRDTLCNGAAISCRGTRAFSYGVFQHFIFRKTRENPGACVSSRIRIALLLNKREKR